MQVIRERSIQQKITLVIVLISSAVLLLACVALFLFQAWSIKKNFEDQLSVTGEIVANNIAVAVMFKDEEQAAQTLVGLKAMPEIVNAWVTLSDGSRLARFGEKDNGGKEFDTGIHIEGDTFTLAQPVLRDGQRHGTLYLNADFSTVYSRLIRVYGGVVFTVLSVSLLLAFLLSSKFQGFVTKPILRLAGTAKRIAEDKDYSVRAEAAGRDEVGLLTDAFNQMLVQIQSQDTALQSTHSELHAQFNSLGREVAERKKAQAAQAQLTAIIDSTPDFVGTADATGSVLFLNPAARRMIGLDEKSHICGIGLPDLHAEWAAQLVTTEGIPTALLAGSWVGETAVRHRDGGETHVSQIIIAHRNTEGEIDRLSTVMRDISERKAAEEALRNSQRKLLETSRLAGMAEVATGVLHNVGNVLNSVNVSADLVQETLRNSKAQNVQKAAQLLVDRSDDLADFLTKEPAGQKLPAYMAKLGTHLVSENTKLLTEVESLARNIEHIKRVVAMQQRHAKVGGIFEDLDLASLVNDSIAMVFDTMGRKGIDLERQFSHIPTVRLDRHQVLQILINLIRNATQSLDHTERSDKKLTIVIVPTDNERVRIIVRDNGVGISKENLTRVFGHGFTTRRDGHGFGLHSGSLAAKEMGGSLQVQSEGEGCGAQFTLELPCACGAIAESK